MGAARNLEVAVSVDPPKKSFLLGSGLDLWLLGGSSLLTYVYFRFFISPYANLYALSILMYGLSMVVNWPHFIASYQLLYWDHRRDLLRKPALLWAAVVVPVLMVGVIGLGFLRDDRLVFSLLVQVMFLTVGWHYVKQVFGTMVVSSAGENFFMSQTERRWLLASLYSVWGMSFVSGQAVAREADFYGLKYDLLGMGERSVQVGLGLVAFTAVGTLLTFGRRYLKEKRGPSKAAWMSYLTLYVWYLPFAAHPAYNFVIPFFHSVQYFVFVIALKKNKLKAELAQARGASNADLVDADTGSSPMGPPAQTLQFEVTAAAENQQAKGVWKGLASFYAVSLVVGLVVFWQLPGWLDRQMPAWNAQAALMWSPTLFVGLFQVFINVHHYFIDNVIWKKDNPDVRAYLFRRD